MSSPSTYAYLRGFPKQHQKKNLDFQSSMAPKPISVDILPDRVNRFTNRSKNLNSRTAPIDFMVFPSIVTHLSETHPICVFLDSTLSI
jgi:hypothetical protein